MGWVVAAPALLLAIGCLGLGMWAAERSERRRGRRSDRWFVLRGYPLVIVAIVLGALFVVPVSVSGSTVVRAAVWTVTLLLAGFGLVVLGRNLAGHDPAAVRIAERLSGDEPSRRLLTRWLQRVRWRRWLGGFLGVLLTLLLSGDGHGPGLLVLAFAGIMAGSLSAELHHWRRAGGGGARAADLADRRLGDYTVTGEQWLLGAVAAGSVVLLAADLAGVTPGATDRGPVWPWVACIVGVVAVVAGMQWRIVTRRRPALPAELRRADDLARRLAVSRGVAQPGLALGLALTAEASTSAGLRAVGGVCSLLAAGLWIGTRRLGLDKLLAAPALEPTPAAAGPAGA